MALTTRACVPLHPFQDLVAPHVPLFLQALARDLPAIQRSVAGILCDLALAYPPAVIGGAAAVAAGDDGMDDTEAAPDNGPQASVEGIVAALTAQLLETTDATLRTTIAEGLAKLYLHRRTSNSEVRATTMEHGWVVHCLLTTSVLCTLSNTDSARTGAAVRAARQLSS